MKNTNEAPTIFDKLARLHPLNWTEGEIGQLIQERFEVPALVWTHDTTADCAARNMHAALAAYASIMMMMPRHKMGINMSVKTHVALVQLDSAQAALYATCGQAELNGETHFAVMMPLPCMFWRDFAAFKSEAVRAVSNVIQFTYVGIVQALGDMKEDGLPQ